jgi:hypothetical protein
MIYAHARADTNAHTCINEMITSLHAYPWADVPKFFITNLHYAVLCVHVCVCVCVFVRERERAGTKLAHGVSTVCIRIRVDFFLREMASTTCHAFYLCIVHLRCMNVQK